MNRLNISKLITKSVVTSASVHDSQVVEKLIDEKDNGENFYADSAYVGKNVKRVLRKHKMKDKVIKRAKRGQKLSKYQETLNKKNSSVRVRVEHVFGFCEQSMHRMYSRAVGIIRNSAIIGLMNLVYNMLRYEQIQRLGMN